MTLTDVNDVSFMRSTNSTKPSSATDATAAGPSTNVVNCMKRASAAGASNIAGGMNTNIAGAPSATGTNEITIVIKRRQRDWAKLSLGPTSFVEIFDSPLKS